MDRTLQISPTATARTRVAGRRGWAGRRLAGASARRVTLAATVACAILLGVFLLRGHIVGGEALGLVAAVAGVVAGALGLAAGRGARRRLAMPAAIVLWTMVILLGVTGTFDHAKPVKAEYVDQRPRPVLVPLVLSVIGCVAIAATAGSRGRKLRIGSLDEEAQR